MLKMFVWFIHRKVWIELIMFQSRFPKIKICGSFKNLHGINKNKWQDFSPKIAEKTKNDQNIKTLGNVVYSYNLFCEFVRK